MSQHILHNKHTMSICKVLDQKQEVTANMNISCSFWLKYNQDKNTSGFLPRRVHWAFVSNTLVTIMTSYLLMILTFHSITSRCFDPPL